VDDALSSLLRDVQPRGALFDRSIVSPPWSVRFEHRAPLTLATMVSGRGWVVADGVAPVEVGTGDVAVVSGPAPFVIADSPGTPPGLVVHPGDVCLTPTGDIADDDLAVCTVGDSPEGSSVLLTGTYAVRGSVSDRVIHDLPRVLVVPAGAVAFPSTDVIVAELGRDTPGRQVVLDRLLDLLLVSTLREWFDRAGAGTPAWYRAQGDPIVGTALRLIHDDPAQPWTVASLARRAGASRAGFARRFAELVGEPPISYLTCWRICLAADLLRQTDATVDAIARQVGYANAYALSVAFTRVHGVRPTQHRAAGRVPVGTGT
jgi:AraC-like DNA-binding protein